MTEAVVVLPLFLLLLGFSLFAARLYGRTAQARHEARHAAWAYALNACEGDAPAGVAAQEVSDPTLDLVADDPSLPPDAERIPEDGEQLLDDARRSDTGLELGDSWGVARATIDRGAVYASVLPMFRDPNLPNAGFETRASFEVQCNEKARGARPLDVLRFIWSLPETLNLELF
jgi:hypothetical protein